MCDIQWIIFLQKWSIHFILTVHFLWPAGRKCLKMSSEAQNRFKWVGLHSLFQQNLTEKADLTQCSWFLNWFILIYSVWQQTGLPGSIPGRSKGFSLQYLCPASYPMGTGFLSGEGKSWPGRNADHSSPFSEYFAISNVKQSRYTQWRRLGREEV
jgi:hypothetical protein